jgi:hypothetical protein
MVKDFLKKTFVAKIWRYYCRTRSAYIDKYLVPPYEEKRVILLEYKRKFRSAVFIETGTFLGDSVAMFLKDFDAIYSFELSKELALRAEIRFKDEPHVRIINADSGKELRSLTASIDKPTLFWLDGHYSSEFFVGNDFIRTARGEKDTPIVEELNAILTSGIKENVILIDDARCFNGTNDYPSLRELKKLIYTLAPTVKVKIRRDIIRITPV